VELDLVDLPNYIKNKLLIGDCGFYINEIEGMYLDVIGRNLLRSLKISHIFEIGLLPFVSIECNIVMKRIFTHDFFS
jgi:hypothetical protein